MKHTNNVINGVYSGMSNKVDDKLAQCERAIRALESLRERQDKSEFECHFCAYIGFADAINNYVPRLLKEQLRPPKLLKEQLRPPTLAKTWLDRLINPAVDRVTFLETGHRKRLTLVGIGAGVNL